MGEFLVICYALINGVAVLYTRWWVNKHKLIWLVPFAMFVANFAIILYIQNSSDLSGLEANGFWGFMADTLFDSMVALWSAVLGAVFISGAPAGNNQHSYDVRIIESQKES